MGDTEKRPRGRPAQPDELRRRNNLTLRIRDETRAALEREASGNGRSMSEEAELRLDQSFLSQPILDQLLDLAFGHQLAGLLLLFGQVMKDTGSHAGFVTKYRLDDASNWLNNPYAFGQAYQAVIALLEVIRPEGDIVPPKLGKLPPGWTDLDALYSNLGASFAHTALGALAGNDQLQGLTEWAERVQKRLGPAVVGRIAASGSAGIVPASVAVG